MRGAVVHRKLRFGPFELSIGKRGLRRDVAALPLGDRALDTLIYLAERPGEVIAKKRRLATAGLAIATSQTSRAATASKRRSGA